MITFTEMNPTLDQLNKNITQTNNNNDENIISTNDNINNNNNDNINNDNNQNTDYYRRTENIKNLLRATCEEGFSNPHMIVNLFFVILSFLAVMLPIKDKILFVIKSILLVIFIIALSINYTTFICQLDDARMLVSLLLILLLFPPFIIIEIFIKNYILIFNTCSK